MDRPERTPVTTETDEIIQDVGKGLGCFVWLLAILFVGFLAVAAPLIGLPIIVIACIVLGAHSMSRTK